MSDDRVEPWPLPAQSEKPLDRTGGWTDWSLRMVGKVEDRYRQLDAEGFRGVGPAGELPQGLVPLRATGIDVVPAVDAVKGYLSALTKRQHANGRFPMEHRTWRQWMNGTRYFLRHGLCLEDLADRQRDLALAVMQASLSPAGYRQLIDMMHLNHTVGEMRGEQDQFTEWMYWFSVYGDPAAGGVWGWQLDGHHVVVNCVYVGDQLTITPTFLGAEPVYARNGKYAGTRVFGPEEALGFAVFASLDDEQRRRARIAAEMPEDLFTGAFRDNFELNYEGVRIGDLDEDQRAATIRLIAQYVDRAPQEHAELKMADVLAHLDETYFAWIGTSEPGGVFYYRVHSPVVLIEFEHQAGLMFETDGPTRNHIHTVVRTPNGGDYGIDLLRQHHELHHHDAEGHHHPHEHVRNDRLGHFPGR